MKAGVCLQLSNTSDRDAWRRRGLIEANLLTDHDHRRGRVLIEPT